MELRQYFAVIWKWLWLIVLASGVAAVAAFLATRSAPPIYQSATTLMVGQTIQNPNPGSQEMFTSQQLAQTYAQVAQRQPVLQAAAKSLGLGDWEGLRQQIAVYPIAGSQLLEIRVSDTSPARAQAIANAIAEQVILQSPTPNEKDQETNRQFANSQLADLRGRIQDGNAEIKALEEAVSTETSARRIQDLQAQITAKQAQLNIWQTNYTSLLTFAKGGTNYLSVVEPANFPTRPVGPRTALTVALAASLGLLLALAAAFLIEYLDDTIKSPDDVERLLKASTLGSIARIQPIVTPSDVVITSHHPKSSYAEAYRVLRTNIQFAAVDNPGPLLLITSTGPDEGKSTTAANVAVAMAQTNLRTLLVDTDLRRPRVHSYFDLPNKFGLTNLLLQDKPNVGQYVQSSGVPYLQILTSGAQPPNPSELLASQRMDGIIRQVSEQYDAVVFDSPPVLAVADATILASKVKRVVLVVDAGSTRTDLARKSVAALKSAGATLLGVALNRISRRGAGYGYYYYYTSADGEGKRAGILDRLLGRNKGLQRRRRRKTPPGEALTSSSHTEAS